MSWPIVSLGDVSEVTMGQAPPGESYNDIGNGLPLIAGAGDFKNGVAQAKKYTTSASKVAAPHDIILGIRASIGAKVIADRPYCLGRGVAGLRPKNDRLDQRFLWHWLTHASPELAAKGRGATFLQVNRADITSMGVTLPPIEEQRRIAAILDRADAIRKLRLDSIQSLDKLTQSIFHEMFGKGTWPIFKLSEVVAAGTDVTYGIIQAGPEIAGGVPYIRTGDIARGEIVTSGLRRTDPAIAARFGRSRVQTGDIVMSIRATVGTTAVVPAEIDGANLTQGTARISPGTRVTGLYLLNYLRSDAAQRWIQAQVKGATFREITLGRLRELRVPIPTVDHQHEFAHRAQSVINQRDILQRSLLNCNELGASLRARAFSGRL